MDGRVRQAAITLELADPEATIVHVRGQLDLGTAARFRAVLNQAVHGERCVVVDLRECSFIDSVSIGLMLTARRKATTTLASCESPMAVVAGGAVARTLEMVGADRVAVPVRANVDDALRAVEAPA
jgi:anti-anti-sigma factor